MAEPTVVLLHGARHGAWSWDLVRERLKAPSVAFDLPGHGDRPGSATTMTTRDFVDAVVDDVTRELPDGEVVLVGHSLGGMLLPLVADRLPGRVAHLVFFAGTIPESGGRVVDTLPPAARIPVLRDGRRSQPTGRAAPDWLTRRLMFNDMPKAQASALLERLGPEPAGLTVEVYDLPASIRDIPRTFVRFSKDRTMSMRRVRRMIKNIGGAKLLTVEAGHDGIISRPGEVADIIQDIVKAPSSPAPAA